MPERPATIQYQSSPGTHNQLINKAYFSMRKATHSHSIVAGGLPEIS